MPNNEGVNIVISGDNSMALKAIEQLVQAINGIHDSNVKITADASQAIGEAGKVADTVESVNDAHADITADSSQAVGEADKASNALENVNDAHAKIIADGSQAVDEAGKVAEAENAIKDAHADITADGSQAVDELKRLEKLIFGIDGKKVEFQVRGVIQDEQGQLRNLKGQFLKTGRELGEALSSGANSGIERIQQSLNNMLTAELGNKISATFSSLLNGMVSTATKAANVLSSITKNALSIGGGFEAQMTSVQVISGAMGKDLQELTDKARERLVKWAQLFRFLQETRLLL